MDNLESLEGLGFSIYKYMHMLTMSLCGCGSQLRTRLLLLFLSYLFQLFGAILFFFIVVSRFSIPL